MYIVDSFPCAARWFNGHLLHEVLKIPEGQKKDWLDKLPPKIASYLASQDIMTLSDEIPTTKVLTSQCPLVSRVHLFAGPNHPRGKYLVPNNYPYFLTCKSAS